MGFLRLYVEGFKNLSYLGKKLWIVIIVKLIIFFGIVRLFFPDILHERFDSDKKRADYVLEQLTGGGE